MSVLSSFSANDKAPDALDLFSVPPNQIAVQGQYYEDIRPVSQLGWSGGAKVLVKVPVPTILNIVGQGPTALAVGAGGGCLDIFTLIYPFSSLSPSLWETARYRLKYCLKGPLNPQQPTNQCITISADAVRI